MKNPFKSTKFHNFIFLMFVALGICFTAREDDMSILGTIFIGAIVGVMAYVFIVLLIGAFKEINRRVENRIDLTATLETDPEKVKSHMLSLMQYGTYKKMPEVFREFNDIFRNYPQWELEKWDVFRAWYKDLIDHCIANPEIFHLTNKEDGSAYVKELDPLYDPDAPNWEQFAAPVYDDEDFDDDTAEEDEHDENDKTGGLFSSNAEALGFGMGLGLMGVSIGSSSSGGG